MKQPVALFDIDGTVFRSSLLIELVTELVQAKVFPAEVHTMYEVSHQAWLEREGTYQTYINDVIEAFLTHITGVYYGDFADVGRNVVTKQRKRVYRYTRDLIKTLKQNGYYLVAISQSPKSILDEFCSQYGFDKVYGRIYELDTTGCFTGSVTDEYLIKNKANIAQRVFEQGNFAEAGSIAIGDTDGDISLLQSVERAICFNPNQILFEHAKRNGWEVVVERKDVIYTL